MTRFIMELRLRHNYIRLTLLFFLSQILEDSNCDKLECYIGRLGGEGKTSTKLVKCTTPPTVRPITSCLIARYQVNDHGGQSGSGKLLVTEHAMENLACDESHVCDQEDGTTQDGHWVNNASYKGLRADLYCCQIPKCNDPRGFPKPETPVDCLVGKCNSEKYQGEYQRCTSSMCYNTTVEATTTFGCDMNRTCELHGLEDSCKDITQSSVTRRICCCEKTKCNYGMKFRNSSLRTTSVSKTTESMPVISVIPMDPHILPDLNRQKQLQKSKTAGIVSASVLGVALLVMFAVIGFKQWQKYRNTYNFSYMQLTADMMTL